jgi:hypothetical protein
MKYIYRYVCTRDVYNILIVYSTNTYILIEVEIIQNILLYHLRMLHFDPSRSINYNEFLKTM